MLGTETSGPERVEGFPEIPETRLSFHQFMELQEALLKHLGYKFVGKDIYGTRWAEGGGAKEYRRIMGNREDLKPDDAPKNEEEKEFAEQVKTLFLSGKKEEVLKLLEDRFERKFGKNGQKMLEIPLPEEEEEKTAAAA